MKDNAVEEICVFCGAVSYGTEGDLAIRTENGIRIFGYEGLDYDFVCTPCSSRTISEYADWQISEHRR